MKKFWDEVKYGFYISIRPFKGFWNIKREGQGSVRAATFLLVLYTLLSVISGYMTGYLFNPHAPGQFQALKQIFIILALFFGYCIANWALTCLFDGEGTFKDIYRATGYALFPLIISQMLLIPLSNYFVMSEQAFYSTINTFALLWAAFLLLISILVTHGYELGKGVLIVICIIFGMCLIAYIALLFFNLIQQVIGFMTTVFIEFFSRFS